MPRFVLLEHDHPHVHWDLMLERDASLRTWRLSAPPTQAAAIQAEALADHRLAYLDYEGPVSGNRGTVTRWDAGDYRVYNETPGRIEIELEGARIRGIAMLTREGEHETQWQLQFFRI